MQACSKSGGRPMSTAIPPYQPEIRRKYGSQRHLANMTVFMIVQAKQFEADTDTQPGWCLPGSHHLESHAQSPRELDRRLPVNVDHCNLDQVSSRCLTDCVQRLALPVRPHSSVPSTWATVDIWERTTAAPKRLHITMLAAVLNDLLSPGNLHPPELD
jgi:hypothetical protein